MYESYGNIANGGLITKFWHKEVVSDFNKLWFMNTDDEFVYYSDGMNSHYLCRYNENDPEGSVILKKPCTNVTLSGDWLYYINETDHRIYRCLRSGRSESLLMREETSEFVIYAKDEMVYATDAGDLKGFAGTLAEGVRPSKLCVAGGKVFYADGSNNNFLTFMNLNPEGSFREQCVGDIIPTYINSDGQYIYFTDALKGNAIFRLHTNGGNPLKICGESSGYLHIIDDRLFFWNGSAWKQISLEGGVAKEV